MRLISNLFRSSTASALCGGALLAGAIALLPAPSAHAQTIAFTLSNFTSPGGKNAESFFSGTITNTGTLPIYLNELDLNQTSGATGVFTPDTDPFYNLVPYPIAIGGSYTGQLFGIKSNSSFTNTTMFVGNAVIKGGTNTNALNTLGTQSFSVVSATPEPGSFALAATGFAASGLTLIRRRSRRSVA